jgi:hypothetical protein
MFQTTNQLGFDSLHISASTLGFDRFRDDLMIKHKKFMTVAIHQPSLYGSTRGWVTRDTSRCFLENP